MAYIVAQDGTEIYYRDFGSGKPVVLVHGWPLTSDSWDKQLNFFAENGLRAITYDRRGFGKSGQTSGGYDYDTLASDLHAVLEKLNITGATLVGFSMGGGEVVRYLSRYGTSRVAKAALVSAVTPYLLKTEDNPDGVDYKVFDDIEKKLRDDRFAFFTDFGAQFYGRSAMHHTVSQEVVDWFQRMASTGSLRSILGTAKSWSTTDFRDEMKNIHIPVLIIHGTSDKTVPIDASARRSAKLLPNVILSEYDGEAHGLNETAADKLNAELLQFVGGPAEPVSKPVVA